MLLFPHLFVGSNRLNMILCRKLRKTECLSLKAMLTPCSLMLTINNFDLCQCHLNPDLVAEQRLKHFSCAYLPGTETCASVNFHFKATCSCFKIVN